MGHGAQLSDETLSITNQSFTKYLFAFLDKENHVFMVDEENDEKLTNGELIEKSYKAAGALQALGYKKGCMIGISCENRIEYPVIVIAAHLVGATVVPINPDYFKDELEHSLSVTKPQVIFCSSASLDKLTQLLNKLKYIKHIITLDRSSSVNGNVCNQKIVSYHQLLQKYHQKYKPVHLSSKDYAFILYSSGTTGLPKGVTISHQALSLMLELTRTYKMMTVKGSHVILSPPFFHIFGLYLLFQPLVLQHTGIVLPNFKPHAFLSQIQKYKIQTLFAVPTTVNFLAKHPMISSYDLSSLEDILSGGAPMGALVTKELMSKLNLNDFSNLYGMTETTGLIASGQYSGRIDTVGRVSRGMELKIIDIETGNSLGPMAQGELCVRGFRVTDGYYGNSEETKKAIDEEGWLHTGDVAFYDKDEYIYVVNRLKELIKFKGFQVAPAELELLISKHPGVVDVAVAGIPDEIAGELPKAYVVKRPGVNVSAMDIIKFVAGRISKQKQLSGGVTFVEEIPRNASGKILRRKLRENNIIIGKSKI